jgi:hypothetical protein
MPAGREGEGVAGSHGAAEPGLAVPVIVSTQANASVIRLRTCWLVR